VCISLYNSWVHHIHTTDGFVVGSKPYGEAGKIFFIYTRDLGLLTAVAQGIRLEKSKLRYNINDYGFSSFSLVHGKEFWRIVGASHFAKVFSKEKEKDRLAILAPVALILKRLLHGEEQCEGIFQCLENCAHYIDKEIELNEEKMKVIESLTVARVLYLLGYVGKDDSLDIILRSLNYDRDLIERMKEKRLEINRKINLALKESHL